jgi:hypothetical protein
MSPLELRHVPQFGNRWRRRTAYQTIEFQYRALKKFTTDEHSLLECDDV